MLHRAHPVRMQLNFVLFSQELRRRKRETEGVRDEACAKQACGLPKKTSNFQAKQTVTGHMLLVSCQLRVWWRMCYLWSAIKQSQIIRRNATEVTSYISAF